MEYGLIGEKLGHSYSKEIHESLADYTYEIHPVSKEDFDDFMSRREFKSINVTIPYKKDVIHLKLLFSQKTIFKIIPDLIFCP